MRDTELILLIPSLPRALPVHEAERREVELAADQLEVLAALVICCLVDNE
jgi:hypothetical protein